MPVERWYEQRDGVLSETAMRRKLEQRGYQVERYLYPPGTVFPPHQHRQNKLDAVLSGRLRLVLQGRTLVLEAGDCLAIAQGVTHGAEVVGSEPVISLDGVRWD